MAGSWRPPRCRCRVGRGSLIDWQVVEAQTQHLRHGLEMARDMDLSCAAAAARARSRVTRHAAFDAIVVCAGDGSLHDVLQVRRGRAPIARYSMRACTSDRAILYARVHSRLRDPLCAHAHPSARRVCFPATTTRARGLLWACSPSVPVGVRARRRVCGGVRARRRVCCCGIPVISYHAARACGAQGMTWRAIWGCCRRARAPWRA